MMGSYSETEEDKFFDPRDDLSLASDLGSEYSESCLSPRVANSAIRYEFWSKKPESVNERRDKFLKWMGLSPNWRKTDEDDDDISHEEIDNEISRLRDNGEAELANVDSEQQYFAGRSLHGFNAYDPKVLLENGALEESPKWKIKNLDDGTEFVMDELTDDGALATLREVGSDKMISLDEFQKTLGSSSLVRQLLKEDSKGHHSKVDSMKKVKNNWLQRLSAITHIAADKTKGLLDNKPNEIDSETGSTSRRVRVHATKKHSKELSSIYIGQQFPAHEGSILTMKFSPDGCFLASAGVDGVVRVWKVLEDDIVNKFNVQDVDPSCLYFSLSNSSKLSSLDVDKEKMKGLKRSSDSPCVVLPPNVFELSEKPLHEFHGHEGEVLSLSWSTKGHLLSSSVDKTARLWRIGNDHCLGVFPHNNYVTCVEFNPMDDNHFISGSIDGKLRIWEVQGGRVVDWTDIREIVTAVCYCPDGTGGVVGSMDGNCRFYNVVDNRLELGDQICLTGKKKLPGKRITGFQYCPGDVSKVMVTSADSQVRILCGTNVVCKFKGSRSSVSQVPASFTSDGEHIVSVSEDSNVRVWNYMTQDQKSSRPKNLKSCESFTSRNASIAIPWCGDLKNKLGSLPGSILRHGPFDEKLLQKLPASFPDCLTMSLGFFLDALYKGSPTWPEEKLPESNPTGAKCKPEFKFLKNALLSKLNAPHLWGLVIVTAGWDGCIRTFLNYGLPIRF